MKSEIILKSALQDQAAALLLVGPSREFAAVVVALLASAGAANPAMLDIIKSRWPKWTVIE